MGPLARGFPLDSELPTQPAEVVARHLGYNYGELSFAPGDPPQAVFVCRDADGEQIYRETFSADMRVTSV